MVYDVEDQLDTILAMMACHRSQFFGWLPYAEGVLDTVPSEEDAKLTWLRDWYDAHILRRADRFREALVATYGPEHGKAVKYVEAFEISEYASGLDDAAQSRLFPRLTE